MNSALKIGIIEDNPVIREGFATAISIRDEYDVIGCFDSCEAAFNGFLQKTPDLVLMDIDLPGMDGIKGTELVKKKFPNCIVLIITVLEDSDKVFRSLCAGAGGYIVKNSAIADILTNIDQAFSGGAPMSLHIAKMVVGSFKQSEDSPLSNREKEVLQGIAAGKSYSKIALDLFIGKETVRTHIRNIYQKLAVNSKEAALKVAGTKRWLS